MLYIKSCGFDVFLGGTLDSEWRAKFLKLLEEKESKIKCYNPVVEKWTYESIVLENLVKQNAKYHVYVLTPNMMGVYSIAEMVDSAHENGVETYICIKHEDEKDGESVYWHPKMINSINAISNLLIRHGAHKASNLEELVNKLVEAYRRDNK